MIDEIGLDFNMPNVYDQNFDLQQYRENTAQNNYQHYQIMEFLNLAEKTKAKLDLPFDQIYHKERYLIDRVAQLEIDLVQAIES